MFRCELQFGTEGEQSVFKTAFTKLNQRVWSEKKGAFLKVYSEILKPSGKSG